MGNYRVHNIDAVFFVLDYFFNPIMGERSAAFYGIKRFSLINVFAKSTNSFDTDLSGIIAISIYQLINPLMAEFADIPNIVALSAQLFVNAFSFTVAGLQRGNRFVITLIGAFLRHCRGSCKSEYYAQKKRKHQEFVRKLHVTFSSFLYCLK